MSLEAGAALVAVVAIVAYTVFGGADFGGGIWSALASGPRRNQQRQALEDAIGPVWETNHVWLILLVVTLFTAFPGAFGALFTALYVPLFLALVGIVARGAAFGLRHYGEKGSRISAAALTTFSVASTVTPFVFGLCVGAVAGGAIEIDGTEVTSEPFAGWLSPFALACGVIGLLLSAFLAAAYMVPRTQDALQQDFRRRAIAASLALGVVTTAAIPIAIVDADVFAAHLDRPLVLMAMAGTALLGILTLLALVRGVGRLVEVLAAATAAGVVVAWALAQAPYLVADDMRFDEVAAPDITLVSFLIALPAGSLVLIPSLLLLYATFSREELTGEADGH